MIEQAPRKRVLHGFASVLCWSTLGLLFLALVHEAWVEPEKAVVHDKLTYGETASIAHGSAIWGLAVDPRGGRVAAAGWSGEVWLKDSPEDGGVSIRQGATASVRGISFDPDSRSVLLVGDGPGIRILDADAPERSRRMFHEGRTFDDRMAFAPKPGLIAVGGPRGTILVGDLRTGRPRREFDCGGARPAAFVFSPDGTTLAVLDAEGILRASPVRGGKDLWSIRAHSSGVGAVGAVYSPDGGLVATGTDLQRSFRLWRAVDGAPVGGTDDLASGMTSLAFSPDGSLVAFTHTDGTLSVWDVAGSRVAGSLRANGRCLRAVAFHDRGRSLVTCGIDGFVRVWDVGRALAPESKR